MWSAGIRKSKETGIQASPFPRERVLQTRDPDEAAARLGEAAIPYVSELLPGSPPFSTEIYLASGAKTRLARVATRGAMHVRSRLPADSYAMVLDRRQGAGLHRAEKQQVVVNAQFAFLQSPLQAVEVLTPSDFDVLFLRFERVAVIDELQKMLGSEVGAPLAFSPACRMDTVAGEHFRALYRRYSRLLCAGDAGGLGRTTAVRELENEIITLLLQAQPHNYTRLLHRGSSVAVWQLKAAEEFIAANAHLSPSLGDICQAVGVNARTLQHSFRVKRGSTPMQFLQRVRMERARAGLQNPEETTSVTSQAARWGFLHFGRFSREYRKRFGELPSETLRRARGKSEPQ